MFEAARLTPTTTGRVYHEIAYLSSVTPADLRYLLASRELGFATSVLDMRGVRFR